MLDTGVAEPEPPLVGWSRSRFFCWPEPRAGATFSKQANKQAKKERLVVVTKQMFRAIYNGKCDPKKTCINNSLLKNVSVWWSRSRLERFFLPGAGADPNRSEPESALGPRTSGAAQ